MTSHSENSHRNVYGKKVFQRSNVPTRGHIKIYNVLFMYFMFLYLGWNVVFWLEHVGTRFQFFSISVGTFFAFQPLVKMFQRNDYYLLSTRYVFKMALVGTLERWSTK